MISENDNKNKVLEEPKRQHSPISSEASSRLSSPESNSSNSSTYVHYKKRVSRTFAESQNKIIGNIFLSIYHKHIDCFKLY